MAVKGLRPKATRVKEHLPPNRTIPSSSAYSVTLQENMNLHPACLYRLLECPLEHSDVDLVLKVHMMFLWTLNMVLNIHRNHELIRDGEKGGNERTNDFFINEGKGISTIYFFSSSPRAKTKTATTKTIENKIIINSKTHINY